MCNVSDSCQADRYKSMLLRERKKERYYYACWYHGFSSAPKINYIKHY